MKMVLSKCPACYGTLYISELRCSDCGMVLSNTFELGLFEKLSIEQQSFLLSFLRCRGNLKNLQNELQISYPTAKKRLDDLLLALNLVESADDSVVKEVLDMRTWFTDKNSTKASEIIKHMLITQNGKFEYYERIGHDVVPGTVIGEDGEPVTGDAGAALKRIRQNSAALVTVGGIGELLGGYKGYGFAMFVKFLCAALSDGCYGKQLNGVDENGEKCAPRLGHFFIAIDTNHFMGEDVCRKKAGDIIRAVRASRKMPGAERIYTAGEKEYEIRQARRDGVPINDSVQAELNQLRRETGLEGKYRFPWD